MLYQWPTCILRCSSSERWACYFAWPDLTFFLLGGFAEKPETKASVEVAEAELDDDFFQNMRRTIQESGAPAVFKDLPSMLMKVRVSGVEAFASHTLCTKKLLPFPFPSFCVAKWLHDVLHCSDWDEPACQVSR